MGSGGMGVLPKAFGLEDGAEPAGPDWVVFAGGEGRKEAVEEGG